MKRSAKRCILLQGIIETKLFQGHYTIFFSNTLNSVILTSHVTPVQHQCSIDCFHVTTLFKLCICQIQYYSNLSACVTAKVQKTVNPTSCLSFLNAYLTQGKHGIFGYQIMKIHDSLSWVLPYSLPVLTHALIKTCLPFCWMSSFPFLKITFTPSPLNPLLTVWLVSAPTYVRVNLGKLSCKSVTWTHLLLHARSGLCWNFEREKVFPSFESSPTLSLFLSHTIFVI